MEKLRRVNGHCPQEFNSLGFNSSLEQGLEQEQQEELKREEMFLCINNKRMIVFIGPTVRNSFRLKKINPLMINENNGRVVMVFKFKKQLLREKQLREN